jgi:SAM-dependent methyltransferase
MSIDFKRKVSGSTSSNSVGEPSKAARPPPAYGSHRYWEDRYSVLFQRIVRTSTKASDDDEPSRTHADDYVKPFAWYFSYGELRPIILPLILEEVDDCDDASAASRGGLAVLGPIGILEIGCGDSPLGVGIAEEIMELEATAGWKHSDVIQRIVCSDYSSSVIDVLRKGKEDTESSFAVDVGDVPVSFEVIDARKLPYADGSFDLILEKGVLDAMLSDAEKGRNNCVAILSECGRALVYDGFFVIVSHQNPNTSSGKRWLEGVIYYGLQKVSGTNWLVEIHSSSFCDDGSTPGGVGPAVYVFQKSKAEGDSDGGNFAVRSYTY